MATFNVDIIETTVTNFQGIRASSEDEAREKVQELMGLGEFDDQSYDNVVEVKIQKKD